MVTHSKKDGGGGIYAVGLEWELELDRMDGLQTGQNVQLKLNERT